MINALNSGADGFMADFEDANSPTWRNMVARHINLSDAIDRTITYEGSDGRHYELAEEPATLLVRPRGWHLAERHLLVDGEPIVRLAVRLRPVRLPLRPASAANGSGPYFYLPKLESHLEARLWNDVFCFAQDAAGIERGTIQATVLIETLPAAFEMDEILYELREHSAGLNAGRWDYIFSAIKCFPDRREMVLPDRGEVTMTVPFMRAYTELLAATCHRRGAHAMGGMAALIPSRKDPEANAKALASVRADKEREVAQGYDGTWVAHPDLVPVAREVFERGLDGAPNQLERRRDDVKRHRRAAAGSGLDAGRRSPRPACARTSTSASSTSRSGSRGRGAAAINSLMEDAATAEISRSQIWQWVRHGVELEDGRTVTPELVRRSWTRRRRGSARGGGGDVAGRAARSRRARSSSASRYRDELIEFLTLPAYDYLD